jgi:hypothetical protein
MKNSSHIDTSKAISPLEALNLQIENIHPGIFECINELLVRKLRKSHGEEKCQAYITVSELKDLFKQKYLLAIEGFWYEFESIYEKKGWKIHYDDSVWSFIGSFKFLNEEKTNLDGTIHFNDDENEK